MSPHLRVAAMSTEGTVACRLDARLLYLQLNALVVRMRFCQSEAQLKNLHVHLRAELAT